MADSLRDFRHKVSVLKKQGLLPSSLSNGIKLDARSVHPNWHVKGKTLSSLIKKYDDVASGKATAIDVPKNKLTQFRKAGFSTSQGKVIVPHAATEKVRLKAGEVSISNKSGIERVQIPVEYHNLDQYLRDIRKNRKLINRMKRDNEYFGIRFYGGQRAHFYDDVLRLMADLTHYDSISAHKLSRFKQHEIYKNIEIIKFTRKSAEKLERDLDTKKRVMSNAYNRKRKKRFMKKLKGKPKFKQEQYANMNAKAQKAYRDSLSSSEKKKYQEAARRRAAKSRERRK